MIEVTLLKWSDFNPRKDYKRPWWFALDNRILENPDLFDFSAEEFKALIYVFCQASQKNSATVILNEAHANQICRIPESVLRNAIKKMVSYKICTEVYSDLYGTLHNRTVQNISCAVNSTKQVFNFEEIYNNYPKRSGSQNKKEGLKRLTRVVINQEHFEKFSLSVANYRKWVVDSGKVGTEYVMQFSRFVSVWEEWLVPQGPAVAGSKPMKTVSFE